MAKVKHHKNKGVTIHLNEDEKEGLRALLGVTSIDDKVLIDLWYKIKEFCIHKYVAVDVQTQQTVVVAFFNKN